MYTIVVCCGCRETSSMRESRYGHLSLRHVSGQASQAEPIAVSTSSLVGIGLTTPASSCMVPAVMPTIAPVSAGNKTGFNRSTACRAHATANSKHMPAVAGNVHLISAILAMRQAIGCVSAQVAHTKKVLIRDDRAHRQRIFLVSINKPI